MLELLVLKNLIQRTSRRVKRTSGARDTIMQNPEGVGLIKGGGRLIMGGLLIMSLRVLIPFPSCTVSLDLLIRSIVCDNE